VCKRDPLSRVRCIAIALLVLTPLAFAADELDRQLLSARLVELKSAVAAGHSTIAMPEVLAALYEERGNTLLWDEARRGALLSALSAADREGLNPHDYNVAMLKQLPALAGLTGAARVDADFALTDSLLRYVYHLRFGKVNPASYLATWNFPRRVRSEDPVAALGQLFAATDFVSVLEAFAPKSSLYHGAKAQLRRYREIAASGNWPLVEGTTVLKPGASAAEIVQLRQRLAREGFLVNDLVSLDYDAPLEEAVRAFQKQHGLDSDGVIGARTRDALNTTVGQRIDQLKVNLERLRWLESDRVSRFLAVNIAGFEVHLIEAGKSIWSTRAVVGTPFRQTPTFTADMTYIVINPDWTVPPTILRKDKLPALARDRGYLAKNHLEVIDRGGKPVDASTIDWSRYARAPFPYLLRQVPGPWNALGRVKFIFPNSHFVFLHDTPSRELFKRSQRTFSSGCIRVENPFELVRILLPDWDSARIDAVLASGRETKVSLRQPLPVLVVYLTALALEDGTVRFYDDVYDRDAWVLAALSAGFVYDAPGGLTIPG